jgi:hypothetical protein
MKDAINTNQPLSDGWRCATCGESHAGIPLSFAADFPDMYANMKREERDARAVIGSDQCIIKGSVTTETQRKAKTFAADWRRSTRISETPHLRSRLGLKGNGDFLGLPGLHGQDGWR